ncbi:MAG: M3 family oligoendopeptidase [Chloroflexota bacterium]
MLPSHATDFMGWSWPQIEPHVADLLARPLDAGNVDAWLADWSHLSALIYERYQRLYVATTVNTADAAADRAYRRYLDEIYPPAQDAEQRLKQKLLAYRDAGGPDPVGFAIPLRNLKAEADLYREANLPFLSQELQLANEYDKISGAQSVDWDGEELTISQLGPFGRDPDRAVRQRAWQLAAERQLADRRAIDDLWVQLLDLRGRLAANAGRASYRDFRWQQMLRFDYSPADCKCFHRAIEKVVVPAVQRLHEKRRQRLGVDVLRPWDLVVDPFSRPPLKPFDDVAQLEDGVEAIFRRVDAGLADYFAVMRREGLLDLDNRKNKAPGGYCTDYPVAGRPFVFMNAVGLHEDVQTLLHEGGHAFHVFESAGLPYFQQMQVPLEFAEVASMGMELLAAPYLAAEMGGFYTPADAQRALAEHLEDVLTFWPYMAVVDAFQHWAYENPVAAGDPANCDAQWTALWQRFMVGVDWRGYEEVLATGWQRKLHILQVPFYYVEYGLAQLGALQIYRNAHRDQAGAVAAYRQALALGGTVTLPELYAAAGAKFAFDAETLGDVVQIIEAKLGGDV